MDDMRQACCRYLGDIKENAAADSAKREEVAGQVLKSVQKMVQLLGEV